MSLDKIEFFFKNGSTAFLRAKQSEGYAEIEMIAKKLDELIGKTYKELMETDF